MIHTAELITPITEGEFFTLLHQEKTTCKNDTITSRVLAAAGFKVITAYIYRCGEVMQHFCEMQINLKRIANNGKPALALFKGTEKEIKNLSLNFEKYLAPILPLRANLKEWYLRRIDYAIDIKTPFVEEYIALLQRGNKPPFTSIDNNTQHRTEMEKTHFSGSVRYKGNTVVVNIYDKYKERTKKRNGTYKQIQEAKNTLRVEIQCMKPKVKYIKKKLGFNNTIYPYLCTTEAEKIISYYIKPIAGSGDYYTKERAFTLIDESKIKQETKERLKAFLEQVNQKKSVWKIRTTQGEKQYQVCMRKLKELGINPVTIPRRYKIKKLPNISAFCTCIMQPTENKKQEKIKK